MIKTEGIKYTGSKLKILPYILEMVHPLQIKTALDAFSGTTRVAQAFAQSGYDTTANDIAEWSKVFATCFLKANKPDSFYMPLVDHLNGLEGKFGWFSVNYGGKGENGKRPFQMKNAMRLDAIREEIDNLNLEWEDKCVLLTSLIFALDSVDNTIGHYASYLHGWSSRSYKDLKLRLPRRFSITTKNEVLQGDAFDAVKTYHDLVYLDPPYRKQKNHEVLAYLDAHHMVRQGGRVVIESLKEEEYHDAAGALQYDKESIYGIMKITYYRNR